jgi:hypothetical protein
MCFIAIYFAFIFGLILLIFCAIVDCDQSRSRRICDVKYDISFFSAVQFDHSGSYLAIAGSDIRLAFLFKL